MRYWTGLCGPAPQKMLRAHERRVQGDVSRVAWGPLAAGHPNRRRPPSPVPRQATREPHVGQVEVRTTGGPRAPRIHQFVAIPPRRLTHVIYRDTLRAGVEGRTEVRCLFSSILPPANARCHRGKRDGLVPDALLRRPTEPDAVYKDHLHDINNDMNIIHMAPPTYSDAMVKEKGVARSAYARADKVNGQYLTQTRTLNTECFSSEPDVEARPMLRRLRSYPKVRGQCVSAFAECSSDIHLLLQEAARSAAMRYWRQVRAASVEAAVATCSARYRRHWRAELALQGARLRFSQAYLAFQAPSGQAGMAFGTSSIGFVPADSAQYAAEAAPFLGGPPIGLDR